MNTVILGRWISCVYNDMLRPCYIFRCYPQAEAVFEFSPPMLVIFLFVMKCTDVVLTIVLGYVNAGIADHLPRKSVGCSP